tara:strand:- start:3222 stop:4226 length:1005 start_codon:yes stop_codon:yes gene_type:complete
MVSKDISFVIPVFNRPNEIDELLKSFVNLRGEKDFEIVIVEDGSTNKCDQVIKNYEDLKISYYFKENSGPGYSRNFGMKRAKGSYYIILDSDCILRDDYIENVMKNLNNTYADCFGGVDDAHASFNNFQKAISFSMTSFITTGHLRGGKWSKDFQPRSFNMGISRIAFNDSGGFINIHPGEDPDLSLRLYKKGYTIKNYDDVVVFHKRRISLKSFFTQVYKFGVARSILNSMHKDSKKIIYWFPFFFSTLFFISILSIFLYSNMLVYLFFVYFALILISCTIKNNLITAILAIITTLTQFFAYALGFLKGNAKIFLRKGDDLESVFPKMFFKVN